MPSQLFWTNFLFIAVFHFPLFLLVNVPLFFSGIHCVISFIACAKISFTIAIYFPRIFLSRLEMKKPQMEEMKRMNKKSSYLLLLVWLLVFFVEFSLLFHLENCFVIFMRMENEKMWKSLSLSINWWFKELEMRSAKHFSRFSIYFKSRDIYNKMIFQPHLKPYSNFRYTNWKD